jgi:mannose-6-phosphate isomerase-like protein (cupin superfamily)
MYNKVVFLMTVNLLTIVPSGAIARMPVMQGKEHFAHPVSTISTIFSQGSCILAKENSNFRREVVTGFNSQVVSISLHPGESTGEEIHPVDQIMVIVAGKGEIVLNDKKYPVKLDHLFFIPAGARHNIINTGETDLKLYSVYVQTDYKPDRNDEPKQEE